MKINDYSIYHWSFQFAVFCELNPIYKVVLSKVNGKKMIQKIRNAFTFTTENLIFSIEVSQHFRIKNSTMQIVSRYIFFNILMLFYLILLNHTKITFFFSKYGF